jgi:predicted methyltransferase
VRRAALLSILAAAVLAPLPALAASAPQIAAAVNDPARPAEDRQRDEQRKPAETLAFAGVRSGQSILELVPGRGYYTRILSKAVGPRGHVYAWSPPRRADAPADAPDPAAATRAIAADAAYSNVSVEQGSLAQLHLQQPVDMVFTALNYHDVHNVQGIDLLAFNRSVLSVLKPGGTYIVVDHAAAAGSGARDTSTLHRIDPATVKAEVEAAGFELLGESALLHNSADDHSQPVFDPAIRGHTDQFLLRFRRPR